MKAGAEKAGQCSYGFGIGGEKANIVTLTAAIY